MLMDQKLDNEYLPLVCLSKGDANKALVLQYTLVKWDPG